MRRIQWHPVSTMNADKKKARIFVRGLELAAGEEYLRTCDKALTGRFLSMPEYASAMTVMCYFGTFPEPDTSEIMKAVLRDGKKLALPRTLGGGVMEARCVRSLSGLSAGAYGIPEPEESAELVPPESIDIVLVPALTFDRNGYRLGHGGGYYDRYLLKTPAFTVGLAREKILLERVPREEHDVPVMCLITEKQIVGPV